MVWGAIAGAVVGGLLANKGAKDQNAANAGQSQAQMDFQERMSNTAHQREIVDLRKSGLNPILSAKGGASTPGGAQAQMVNTAKAGVDAARESSLISAQLKNLQADTYAKQTAGDLSDTSAGLQAKKQQTEELIQQQVRANTSGVLQTNALQKIDLDMFSDAELLKNAKSLGLSPSAFATFLKTLKSLKGNK